MFGYAECNMSPLTLNILKVTLFIFKEFKYSQGTQAPLSLDVFDEPYPVPL